MTQVKERWHNPPPRVIFLLFLPALIFESAFNADWFTFKRQFVKILLMAGPMLLFASFATAYLMKALQFESFNGFTFVECVLFGAINSATDPVAVVSLLKALGVSKRISTLIEGESLLNDGTALVFFLVLQEFVHGDSLTVPEIAGKFCQMSIGGPLVGLAFGFIMKFLLSRTYNQPTMEANITVCLPYICFYVCEHEKVHVSGILALVTMGLYMTDVGKTEISSDSEKQIHAIWSYIGFVAETLIFLLTGFVLGGALSEVEPIWFAQLFALYIGLHLIRFLGLILLWPFMRKTGYDYNFKHIVLLSYSGLRGAVGLCLALIVRQDPKNDDENVKKQVLFFSAGIVLLTLVVNAPTTGFLINKLGLTKETEMSKRMVRKVLDGHKKQTELFIQGWKQERSEHGDKA